MFLLSRKSTLESSSRSGIPIAHFLKWLGWRPLNLDKVGVATILVVFPLIVSW